VHCVVDGHTTPLRPLKLLVVERLIVGGVGVPGEAGLNVTSSPSPSTAVHRLVDGHATPASPPYS
jgi:hypothetical protein